MRLFSFSGVAFGFVDNPGTAHMALCSKMRDALAGTTFNERTATYNGLMDAAADHFPSHISLDDYFDELTDAIRLEAKRRLDTESREFAPLIARQVAQLTKTNPNEEVLFVAHSQGCNNAAFTLRYLYDFNREFYSNRSVRCLMLDPKVGANTVDALFSVIPKQRLSFLFYQSENDILSVQNLLRSKFINLFELGDHVWVKGLDHSSIHNWDDLNSEHEYLLRSEYLDYQREWKKFVKRLQQETRGGQLGTMQLRQLDKWREKYPMRTAKGAKKTGTPKYGQLLEGILDFLQGKAPQILKA